MLITERCPETAVGGIVKPLPPEWFTRRDTSAEMRWEGMRGQGYLVPTERFFVRNHTTTPRIDPQTYRLEMFGRGLRGGQVGFSYDDLTALPSVERTVAIECAGNGRSLFASQQGMRTPGSQWGLGAVGVTRWRGVPLAEVLERAGLRPGAVDVMPTELDAPYVTDGVDHGRVRRPLPVGKALDDVLLAYEMNGETLPPDHGFPVRLVVPGWIGIASVKWVGRIEVSTTRLWSPWNTKWYPRLFSEQVVKSAFELPWDGVLPLGRRRVLQGRSWSACGPVRQVEVSTDGGASWRRAHLQGPNRGGAWARWSIPWTPRRRGRTELLARATDAHGRRQPERVPFNCEGYMFWAAARHPVTISA
jgi:DMSO/TMAO reductase YedYZ molybdopterin-dependent catalytic subunit